MASQDKSIATAADSTLSVGPVVARSGSAATRERTRVCIVLGWHWESQIGGAQFQAKCLVDILRTRPEFEIYYLAHNTPDTLDRDGYSIVPFGAGHRANVVGVLLQLPSLYRKLRQLKPQVIYQRCLMPYTGICAIYCALHGVKMVFHVASDNDVRSFEKVKGWSVRSLLHRFSRWLSEFGMRRADFVVTQTESQARTLVAEMGLSSTVIRNFHPEPQEIGVRRSPDCFRVIWVGNFKANKNPAHFIDLAESLQEVPGLEFVMIGRPGGDEFQALRDRLSRLPNLKFLGELPVERVDGEIARSHLLVNTSTFEGYPNTFIQAWLRGVPVLSVTVDPDGCISAGGAGVLAGSTGRLAEIVRQLMTDRERLAALSSAALKFAADNHQEGQGKRLVELLATAAKGGAVGHEIE